MAEWSLPWGGTVLGDAGPYTDDDWTDIWRKSRTQYRAWRGVLRLYANELAVSGVASPISVATGAAFVDGKYYENDAALAVAVPAPAVATRIDLIALRKSWAAQTVRVVRIAGAEGGPAGAVTQVDGVTWDIPLAYVSITVPGVITVTDLRRFLLLGANHELLVPDDGWIDVRDRETWTFIAANQFSVPGDRRTTYRKGAKLRWKEGAGFEYGYVVSSSFGAGITTVTLTGGTDYTLAGGAITDTYISYIQNPDGFPEWFNWLPTMVGYGVVPPNPSYRFCIHGRTVTINMVEGGGDGTSNAVTLTYSLPVAANVPATSVFFEMSALARNNGADVLLAANGRILTGTPTLLSCFTTVAGAAWAAANGKRLSVVGFQLTYEMA